MNCKNIFQICVLYKAFLFTLWVMVFDIVEAFIRGFIHNPGLLMAFEELKTHVSYVWLAAALLIFFSFIRFFAFKELIRVLGKEKVQELFLRKQTEETM